jgi:hypothetical protein
MFYIQEMMTHDVQDNQLMSEGKTADHPTNVDCNNGGSLSISDDDKSLFEPNSDEYLSEDEDKRTTAAEIRPACTWGVDGGITQPHGNPYSEYCCWYGKRQLPCKQNGCNATVHKFYQLNWLGRMQLDSDNNGPFFCPEHNIQRVDYIRQYESRYIKKKGS